MPDRDPDTVEELLAEQQRPMEWGKRKGYLVQPGRRESGGARWKPEFLVADQLYRWSLNDYHYQLDPFTLSEKDFDEAMVASSMFPVADLHDAAITPYARSLRAKDSK